MKRGFPFSINKFYSLGTVTSVQKAMSRLAKEGLIIRVAKGIYSRPKPLASIPSIHITAKAEDIAKTWAQTHKFKICPQGFEEAYRLGLQSQAPVKSIFWTTGPTREFKIGNEIIKVRHTSAVKLRWLNKPEGTLFRGLLTLSPEHTSLESLKIAIKRLHLTTKEAIHIIDKLKRFSLLKRWQPKLQQLEASFLS